jgi:hypothetical protein
MAYADASTELAKPFVWTADTTTILCLVAKSFAAISKSAHYTEVKNRIPRWALRSAAIRSLLT